MCFKKEYALTIVLVIFSMIAFSQNKAPKQIEVSSNEEVYKALEHLNPGDVLLFTDGNYKDLNLIIYNSGTSEQPITIKPKKPGNVFITEDSKVEMRGEHLVLEGFWFKEGNRNVDEWKSHGPGLVAMYGSFNRVTNCVFDSFDEAHSAYITTSLTEDGKVPQYCRIDHCSFTDKITFDQVINLNNTVRAVKDGFAGGPPMYHRVDHNFFSNPKKPGNAGGGIRIGYYRNDLGRCLIDSNLFVRQDSEPEIITSKSQENVFYNNTYVNCQGTMNFRHGDRQVAINNFHIGTDTKYEYGGMFVWGSEHIIASNYFELPTTIKSRGNAALYLNPGPIGSEHALFFNSMIVNNVFVNNNGYDIHFNPFIERREEFAKINDLDFEAPKQLLIKSNLFYSDQNTSYTFFKDDFSEETNVWENNTAFGKPLGIPVKKGIKTDHFIMVKEQNIYKLKYKIDHIPAVITDIPSIKGVDLDLNSLVNKGLQGEPLGWDDVKPYWLNDIPGTYYKNGKLSVERELKFKKVLDRARNQ